MGETIRKDAAVEDILADVNTTLTNATARGGDWQSSAETRLRPIVTLAASSEARVKAAEQAAAPALAEVAAMNDEADTIIGGTSDNVWNDIGRPANDPHYAIMFPGGIDEYTDVRVDDQPYRMELLAEMLEGGLHPALDPAKAATYATTLRQAATRLEEKVDAARPLRIRLDLARRMHTAIARAGAIALRRLKAQWIADGRTEADIHAVIPDRPTSRRKKNGGGES